MTVNEVLAKLSQFQMNHGEKDVEFDGQNGDVTYPVTSVEVVVKDGRYLVVIS